jgi:asparagine synthase (glutamine-hydrolysing)
MCGINGIYSYDASFVVKESLIRQMRDSMVHRGPDDAGEFFGPGIGLGHRRLKIIDLTEAAKQPMQNAERSCVIVYNGEIYNFRELRKDLEEKGFRFYSKSDTEVLLHLYEACGPEMVNHLNGIFAFAIYDAKQDLLFCARDPLGVKPLYYALAPGTFLFASEMKALLAAGVSPEINKDAVGEFLIFHHVSGERTLFNNIQRLLPGHTLTLRRSSKEPISRRYFSVFDQVIPDDGQNNVSLLDLLQEAVTRQMISDVPVGTLCSGGLDSSGLTALAARHAGKTLQTFSINFKEARFSEAAFASRVSGHCGTEHHELVSEAERYMQLLPRAVWHHDEPLMHPNSIPIYQISRLAKEFVTVLLSGEGADEVFGGYYWQGRHALMHRWRPAAARPARVFQGIAGRSGRYRWEKLLVNLAAPTPDCQMAWSACIATPAQLRSAGYSGSLEWPSRLDTANEALRACAHITQARIFYDQLHYLPSLLDRQDKMCMGASIESRVPYLDLKVMRFANRLPVEEKIHGRANKIALRLALREILPAEILGRSKFGFGVPAAIWLREHAISRTFLDGLCTGRLKAHVVEHGLFEEAPLRKVLGRYLISDDGLFPLIWPVLNLELWLRIFFTGTDPGQRPGQDVFSY